MCDESPTESVETAPHTGFGRGQSTLSTQRLETKTPTREQMTDNSSAYEAFCPVCEQIQEVQRTVSWQADLCTVCGSDVESEE
ncbi:hypothetical protein [Natrononativus amylolyticus]|uniref:hypothetical protein n=1 Tax=Natrononativus amylolyticus TaxID=2963434 RepID=UPI0020CC9670|nr:hypothetical protein [Natrononativus amylolyticus]